MTLVLGVVTGTGAWVSSDHRLTALPSGKLVTDVSNKQLHLKCRGDESLIIAYTGIGRFLHATMGEVDVADWIRRSLRARNLSADESIGRLVDCATTRLGPLVASRGLSHHFALVAFMRQGVYAAEVSNVIGGRVEPRFELRSTAVMRDAPQVLAAGAVDAVSSEDLELLKRIAQRVPARVQDYSHVLAQVNKRAASRSRLISSSCTTTHAPAKGEPFSTHIHNADGRVIPAPGMMLFSIDMTDMMRKMGENFEALTRGEISQEEFGRLQESEGQEGVRLEEC